jgi:transposase
MRTRRKYSKEYKADAVRLAEREGVKEAAESLGIDRSMLYQWQKQLEQEGADAFRGAGNRTALEEENRRLRLELKVLKEEAEILKKASAYFAKQYR